MKPWTTRAGFVLGLAFGVLLLIPFWYGLGLLTEAGGHGDEHGGGGHGGDHGGMGSREAVRDFIQETQAFIAQHTRPDGCVVLGEAAEEHEHEHESSHGSEPEEAQGDEDEVAAEAEPEEHPVVYLRALQFAYLPSKICLKPGVTYVFRMMATDVTHGASIHLGPASLMVRLPPGVLVEREVRFDEPGEYLLYCSFYCGIGHPYMKGVILVEKGSGGGEGESDPGDEDAKEDDHPY